MIYLPSLDKVSKKLDIQISNFLSKDKALTLSGHSNIQLPVKDKGFDPFRYEGGKYTVIQE
jgi:hypothetical protein